MIKKVYGTLHGKTSRNMKHVRRDSDEKVDVVLSTDTMRIESSARYTGSIDNCHIKVRKSRSDSAHQFIDLAVRKQGPDAGKLTARLSTSFLLDVLDMNHTISQMLQCEQWRKAVVAQIWMSGAHARE